ncbi:hypothetical protein [Gillisia sp. Hel_I_86]|uniref:hypothetical protein n=1 Tax=Gillisia sp. Hel_I_86 TaxID=1249981 RepID=UPI0021BDBBF7|nr:hypothetical protein [Gillisia sp. Hel_I_86]
MKVWFTKSDEEPNKARNHPGSTFLYHYQEYVQQAKDPYGYTQFMEHYWRKYAREKGSMKLEHDPGKELFIDFAGKKLHIIDKETGEVIPGRSIWYTAITTRIASINRRKSLNSWHSH